jgi:hypothetical protein
MVVVDVVDRSVGSGVAAGSGYHTPVASGVWSAGVAAVWGDGHRLRACKISFFFFPNVQNAHNKGFCRVSGKRHTTKSSLPR